MNGQVGPRVAYFSMEIAVDPRMPTYSGGLGVLAGDMLASAADLGLSIVGVTLLHRQGYFHQHLDTRGQQSESPEQWQPETLLEALEPTVTLTLDGRPVKIRAWCHWITGVSGHRVPVYFLDTNLPENGEWERTLTNNLYGGDERYRLCQEAVLGMGGVYDEENASRYVGMGARFVLTGSDHSYIVMGANARSGFFTGLPRAAETPGNKRKRAKG